MGEGDHLRVRPRLPRRDHAVDADRDQPVGAELEDRGGERTAGLVADVFHREVDHEAHFFLVAGHRAVDAGVFAFPKPMRHGDGIGQERRLGRFIHFFVSLLVTPSP